MLKNRNELRRAPYKGNNLRETTTGFRHTQAQASPVHGHSLRAKDETISSLLLWKKNIPIQSRPEGHGHCPSGSE